MGEFQVRSSAPTPEVLENVRRRFIRVAGEVLRLLYSPLFRGVAYLVAAMVIASAGQCERSIRLSGLFLEVAGLLLVLFQLNDARVRFRKPGALLAMKASLERIRGAMLPRINASLTAEVGEFTTVGSSITFHIARQNPTVETRIEDLERDLRNFEHSARGQLEEAKRRISGLEDQIARGLAETEDATRSLREQVEEHAVGDLWMAFLGVLLALMGAIVGTLSLEIAQLLRWA